MALRRELLGASLLKVGTCKFILYFDCSKECMTERLLERAKSSGRVDDNETTIKKRLETFQGRTLPVIDVYEKAGKVRKVCDSGNIFTFVIYKLSKYI